MPSPTTLESKALDLSKIEGLRERSQWWDGQCPMCALENRDSKKNHLRIWKNGAFNCAVDGSKEHNKGILDIAGVNASGLVSLPYQEEKPKNDYPKEWKLDLLPSLIKNYTYWNNRGISDETCREFFIGVAAKGQMAGRSVIPIFNQQKTKIIGFTGRSLYANLTPKYKHLGEKSNWLWPDSDQNKSDVVILVESPACAMYLWDQGFKNVKVLFGTEISSALSKYLLSNNPRRILLATNNEATGIGNKAANKIHRQLLQFFPMERIIEALPPDKDFSALYGQPDAKEKLDLWQSKYFN